jgi:hypothetical protein
VHATPPPLKPPTPPVAPIIRYPNPAAPVGYVFPPISAKRPIPSNRSSQNPLSRAAGCLVWVLVIGAISSAQKNCSRHRLSTNVAPNTYHSEAPRTSHRQGSLPPSSYPDNMGSADVRTDRPNPPVTPSVARPVESNTNSHTDWAPRAQLVLPEPVPPSLVPTPSATATPVANQAATTPTATVPDVQTGPDVLYSIPDLRGLAGRTLNNAGLYGDFTIVEWHPDRAVLRSRFARILRGNTLVVVHFDVTAENRRAGTNVSFPKRSPLRILTVNKSAASGILVQARS